MADVAVTGANVLVLVKNALTGVPAANGVSVATGSTAVLTPAAGTQFKGRYMLVRAVPSAASVLTVRAGVTGQIPANLAAQGDLAFGSSAADSYLQIELARFQQADGTVRIDVTGTGPVLFHVVNLSKSC